MLIILILTVEHRGPHSQTKTPGSGLFLLFELRDCFFACSG